MKQERIISLILSLLLAVATGFLAALFTLTIRVITDTASAEVFGFLTSANILLLLFSPLIGLAAIGIISKGLFKGGINHGFAEVIHSINISNYRFKISNIISHFINGIITVICGGSAGIEVPAVTGSSAIGANLISSKNSGKEELKKQLIICGAAAAIGSLFNSPLGGVLFAVEVLLQSYTIHSIAMVLLASSAAMFLNYQASIVPLFEVNIDGWHAKNLLFYILVAALGSVFSVYLTRSVIGAKKLFERLESGWKKIIVGGLFVGTFIFVFPSLFGEGYRTINLLVTGHANQMAIITGSVFIKDLLLISVLLLIIKPLVTSITLASGGDGGVIAPSLFIGALVGFVVARMINVSGMGNVTELNFVFGGMAAVLSASIHAPLTAIVIVCSLSGSYTLLVPLTISSYSAFYFVKRLYPFTVYSYAARKMGMTK